MSGSSLMGLGHGLQPRLTTGLHGGFSVGLKAGIFWSLSVSRLESGADLMLGKQRQILKSTDLASNPSVIVFLATLESLATSVQKMQE